MYGIQPLSFSIYEAAKAHALTPRGVRLFDRHQISHHLYLASDAVAKRFTANRALSDGLCFLGEQSKRRYERKSE